MRQHRQELVLAAVRRPQRLFQPFALRDLLLQPRVGPFELMVGGFERGIELFQLAGLLGPKLAVRLGQARVRLLQRLVQTLQLAALLVQLHEHRDLAAQDRRDHRHEHVIDGAELVALQAIEVGHVQRR